MNKDKNIIIILMGVIIVILAVLCVLFATDVIVFNTSKNTNVSNNTVKEEIVNNVTSEEEEKEFLYTDVIDEYKQALDENTTGNINDSTFTYVNVSDYFTYDMLQSEDWYYTEYDIDKNGVNELLVSYYSKYNSEYTVSSIFTYNNGIVKVQDYWSRNYLLNIYENGMVTAYGSNGASSSSYVFGTIDNIDENVYDIETVGNNIIITKNKQNTEFASVSDLLNSYVGTNNSIDIQKFTWVNIK